MVKAPVKPEEIFEDIINDYKVIFDSDLLSIVLYGSAARGEYIPKKSDINFMIVLTEEGINSLSKALKTAGKWRKRKVSSPLFLTKAYIETSLDTFPVEFLNIRSSYRLVYGEDILNEIEIDKNLLRLQCEREFKGKLLQLREAFIDTEGDKKKIQELITQSLPTFFSLFKALLYFYDKPHPKNDRESISALSQSTGLNIDLFFEIIDIKKGIKKLENKRAVPLMEEYIFEVRKLAMFVDKINIAT